MGTHQTGGWKAMAWPCPGLVREGHFNPEAKRDKPLPPASHFPTSCSPAVSRCGARPRRFGIHIPRLKIGPGVTIGMEGSGGLGFSLPSLRISSSPVSQLLDASACSKLQCQHSWICPTPLSYRSWPTSP